MEQFEKKEAYFVDAHQIEKLIKDQFNFDEYSIVAAEELANYQPWICTVNGYQDKYDLKKLELREYCTGVYLNDMALRGVIPTGLYIIDTTW